MRHPDARRAEAQFSETRLSEQYRAAMHDIGIAGAIASGLTEIQDRPE